LKLTVSLHSVYDDVALMVSTDPTANEWRLEVESDPASNWLPIAAVIRESHLNRSTPDLSRWDELRRGEADVIQKAFPGSGGAAPAGAPLAVTWDLSNWSHKQHPTTGDGLWYRFTDPDGAGLTFQYQSLLAEREHVFS